MPSKAYNKFKKNLDDVNKLIDNYEALKGLNRGKRALDHITRSGVLLLASSWEVYVEEVLHESVRFFLSRVRLPSEMPREVRKTLGIYVKNHKNDIKALELAGDGWKRVYDEIVFGHIQSLNTPKKDKIRDLFNSLLGIGKPQTEGIQGMELIDDFVSFRGLIAHKVKADQYVRITLLINYRGIVNTIVKDVDLFLLTYLTSQTAGRQPWNNTY